MMRKYKPAVIILIALCVGLFLCSSFLWQIGRKGLHCFVPKLPLFEKFSNTELMKYRIQFSPVKEAVLIHNGEKKTIDPKDVRLIRLLNFLSYGYNEGQTSWLQGYVLEDEVNAYLACDDPMLEVTFDNAENQINDSHGKTSRMLICGDSYILFVDTNDPEDIRAERFWPYSELIRIPTDDRKQNFMLWGNDYWIDLLLFADFTP